MTGPYCPKCGSKVGRVVNTSGMLNGFQFDAIKAGDWFCNFCPGNGRGSSGLCYWNDSEVRYDLPVRSGRQAML